MPSKKESKTSSGRLSDSQLRMHGFRIHARPKNKPAVWVKDGEYFSHADAVRHALESIEEDEDDA